MDSLMYSSTPDLEMWIIQGTLAWCTSPVQIEGAGGDPHGSSLLENPYIPYQCMDSYLLSIGLGSTSM
ncbi:hypothetical protein BT93_E2296 [Corymbia citriodora subsp. variegata]|nr:hypothetical protein BT93_E2296 [Corymbia citriodora subsp. variegata]